MGLYAAGQVVFLRFPFSDLSGTKLRPAVLIADVGQADWIACQITSNPYIDSRAIAIGIGEFAKGGLRHASYVRPTKLFTANESLIAADEGALTPEALKRVRDAVVSVIRQLGP